MEMSIFLRLVKGCVHHAVGLLHVVSASMSCLVPSLRAEFNMFDCVTTCA